MGRLRESGSRKDPASKVLPRSIAAEDRDGWRVICLVVL